MKRLAILLVIPFLFLAPRFIVEAHGGGQLIAGPQQTGPYSVSVWVNPPQPRAEETLHYTVGVAAPGDGAPVLDAEIMIVMEPLSGDGPAVSAQATTDQSINKLFYETDMLVDTPGRYLATFEVSGSEGAGQLTLELEVLSPSPFNWFLLGLAGLLLVLVLGWWRTRSARRA